MTKISNQYSLTNILTADLANSRLGINNVSPAYALDVTGTARVSGAATFSSSVTAVGQLIIGDTSMAYTNAQGYVAGFKSSFTTQTFISIARSGQTLGSQGMIIGLDTTAAYFYVNDNIDTVFRNNALERMRITSAGLIGIGTSNPTRSFQITRTSTAFINAEGTTVALGSSDAPLSFYSSNVNALNITSGGNVIILSSTGSTTNAWIAAPNSNGVAVANKSGASISDLYYFQNTSGTVGSISVNGGTTTYATSSDYRLKQDLKSFDGLSIIDRINIYDFEWKFDNTRSLGVLAHELQEVLPIAVVGEKDGERMQAVDYSKLVPVLVKAIQELSAENTSLINRIEALENK